MSIMPGLDWLAEPPAANDDKRRLRLPYAGTAIPTSQGAMDLGFVSTIRSTFSLGAENQVALPWFDQHREWHGL
jgi:hypothetical protein